jgi:alkaline phosphatase
MGVSERSLTKIVAYGPDAEMAMDRFEVVGLMTTHPLDMLVTDSAASGTALSTGHKTNTMMVNVSPDGSPLETITEKALKQGKAVGIVSNARLTHATPACFAVHAQHRGDEYGIALNMARKGITVMLGGGSSSFLPTELGGRRTDGQNIVREMEQAGYKVVSDKSELLAVDTETTNRLFGTFGSSHMPHELDRDKTKYPSLAEMTRVALDILDNDPDGFFLMVEAAKIDMAGHSNDAPSIIAQTKAFDDAVEVAIDYGDGNDGTLVVMTADHATGGTTITEKLDPSGILSVTASVDRIADEILESPSPGAVTAAVIIEKYTGLVGLPSKKLAKLTQLESKYDQYSFLGTLIGQEFGVTFIPIDYRFELDYLNGHTGEMVSVGASGPGAHRFGGVMDNTDIGQALAQLLLPIGAE